MKEAKTWQERFMKDWNEYTGGENIPDFIFPLIDQEKLLSRDEAIEEAIGAVPKEEEEIPGYHHADLGARGFNRCRSQTLAALTKLKSKQ